MTRPSADIVKVEWTGTGTASPITLGSTVAGFNAFPAALDGLRVSYSIEHTTSTEREAGVGVYTHSGTTLTRDLVTASTNGGALVNFSAGTKHVRITALAIDLIENVSTFDPSTEGRSLGYIAGRSRWLTADPTASPPVAPNLWICLNDDDVSSPSNAVWGRVVTADEIDELTVADDAITNAKLANMAAWSIKMRNAATSGDPSDAALANINEEASPASGDFVLGFLSTGEIRKYQAGALPAGTGEANTASNIGTDGVGVFDGKVGVDLQFRNIAPASTKITVVLNDNGSPAAPDIDIDVDEDNLTIPAASITSGTLADARVAESNVTQHLGAYLPLDGTASAGNITVITNAHAGRTVKFDQALTLDEDFGAGKWVVLNNVHASSTLTITVDPSSPPTSPATLGSINGAASYDIPAGGEILLRCFANGGQAPQCDARGDATTVDFAGRVVSGNRLKVVTSVSGTLTRVHEGTLVVTSGNIVVPTDGTVTNVTVKAGGAHTITFNATVTAAATTGQVCSVAVQSATVIIITPWTTPQTLS